jgi:hypothetical protein
LARLPLIDQVAKPVEQLGERCQNQGVQRPDHPGLGGEMVGFAADRGRDGGDPLGQGGGGDGHFG